ncbi:MAG: hypothetical protein Kow0047_34160 [Anaerolineae bacterium]
MVRPETREALLQRKNGSLRDLARSLGFPPSFAATLSDVLRERHGNVSLKTENRIRVALGLEPIAAYEVAPCPDCGGVHTGRCGGKARQAAVEVVVIDPTQERVVRRRQRTRRKPRRSVSLAAEVFDRLNQKRQKQGLTWEEFLKQLL